jgi:hypothetical protein
MDPVPVRSVELIVPAPNGPEPHSAPGVMFVRVASPSLFVQGATLPPPTDAYISDEGILTVPLVKAAVADPSQKYPYICVRVFASAQT